MFGSSQPNFSQQPDLDLSEFNFSFHSIPESQSLHMEASGVDLNSIDWNQSIFENSVSPTSQTKSNRCTVELESLKSVKATESACFLCGEKKNRQRVPRMAIVQVWVNQRI